ncbi:MAG: TetR family transcriptional regulator [Sphingomonadales bacterium]|nr:TetR family transcriptional regulator [Sphingomonadales bacterium]
MATRPRVRKSAELRREEILDEAIRQIGRLGYHGFTIRELSSACGMSNAGMLHHFSSKPQLLNAVIDRLEQRQAAALQPQIDRCLRPGGPSRDDLHALLAAMVRLAMESEELSRLVVVIQAEAIDPAHPAHESFRRRETQAVAFLAGLLAPMVSAPTEIARGLNAAMTGLAQQWLREGDAFDLCGTWEVIAARLLSDGGA